MAAKKNAKVQKVMHEFKTGTLHSGGAKGPVVKSKQQAIAIALSEQKKANAKRKKGK
jgi:preprotein translocase subunit YajC